MLKQPKIILIAIFVVILIVLVAVKFPYNIKAPCQIVPKTEWSLIRVNPDKLKSRVLDNGDRKILSYALLQYDREDFVQFEMNPQLQNNQQITAGDTIAALSSSKNQMTLANYEGELEKALANLAMVSTGEKVALQEEALEALRMAEIEYEAFEPQHKRKMELFQKDLIGAEEWEITQASYNIYQRNVVMARARLNAIRSGEKQEIIHYMQAQIDLLIEQIKLSRNKMNLEIIRSPLHGRLIFSGSDSVICKVERVDTLLARMAIPAGELKYTTPGQNVDILISENGNYYTAEVINVHKGNFFINGLPVYILTARIENKMDDLLPGMSGYAKLNAESVTLLTRLVREFRRYAGLNLL
jgi:hypothetical protein